jgi:hypothetical protein
MADRDEKGKFAKGNKLGNRFKANGAQTEIARKGAIASNKKQAERRHLREIAQSIAKEMIEVSLPDKSKKMMSFDEALIFGQYQKAITRGDTKAAKFIAIMLGEYVEKQELLGDPTSPVVLSFKEALKGIDTTVKDEELFED